MAKPIVRDKTCSARCETKLGWHHHHTLGPRISIEGHMGKSQKDLVADRIRRGGWTEPMIKKWSQRHDLF